jgi:hypothetical protein
MKWIIPQWVIICWCMTMTFISITQIIIAVDIHQIKKYANSLEGLKVK